MKGRGEFGRRGEDEACMYLVSQGHTILERNWRCGHLEIDVITLAGDGIHFVEVKSRMVPVQGRPEEAVRIIYIVHHVLQRLVHSLASYVQFHLEVKLPF